MEEALARRLFQRIYSWRFKRANTPDEPRAIAVIEGAVAAGRPVPLLGYWGCGDRGAANAKDAQALARLGEMDAAARAVFAPGLCITFILTDVHAAVNGKDPATMRQYFAAITREAGRCGHATRFLGALWADCGFAIADIDRRLAAIGGAFSGLPQHQLLVRSARKHARGVDPELAARRYWAACTIDAEVIGRAFPGHILFTYNGREYAGLLPPLPTMYLYSLRKKTSVKPWFCD